MCFCKPRPGFYWTALPDDDHLGREFLLNRKLSSKLQTADLWELIPHQKKDMDKLEFEQLPHVTRFHKWMTSFQRVLITGSTHPRQDTDLLAEIDQAKSTQDLDDVGSVYRPHQDEC